MWKKENGEETWFLYYVTVKSLIFSTLRISFLFSAWFSSFSKNPFLLREWIAAEELLHMRALTQQMPHCLKHLV
jgi:hypothetical protein